MGAIMLAMDWLVAIMACPMPLRRSSEENANNTNETPRYLNALLWHQLGKQRVDAREEERDAHRDEADSGGELPQRHGVGGRVAGREHNRRAPCEAHAKEEGTDQNEHAIQHTAGQKDNHSKANKKRGSDARVHDRVLARK